MQHLLSPPLVAPEPPDESLLTLALEPDHEKPIRAIDGWRHDLELRDLRGHPLATLTVTILDGLLEARA